jgi:hypothetical protein
LGEPLFEQFLILFLLLLGGTFILVGLAGQPHEVVVLGLEPLIESYRVEACPCHEFLWVVCEFDLDSFEPVVRRVPNDEAVIMTREGRRESPDGSGKEEGSDTIRLG